MLEFRTAEHKQESGQKRPDDIHGQRPPRKTGQSVIDGPHNPETQYRPQKTGTPGQQENFHFLPHNVRHGETADAFFFNRSHQP
ncbi:hypothetical protein SDC9_180863 [bioreactor metagenome]|uniref:Uncharacterized protein n=1 Tax=bioreactor metagenome TaxID=1076179 RepID=A0A645H2Y6_9ZZZZ